MKREISIIIVGYNSEHVISDCLGFLGASDSIEVILVDNNSTDNTVDVFRKMCQNGIVVRRSTNGGFAAAVNEGLLSANGRCIALLNPDAFIRSEDLLKLARLVDGEVVAAAPMVTQGDGRSVTAGRLPTLWRIFVHMTGLSILGGLHPVFEGHYLLRAHCTQGVRTVDWSTGGCLVVRADHLRSLGGLNDRWFMYGEDIDFCWRSSVHTEGTVMLDTSIIVRHLVGKSTASADGTLSDVWLRHLYEAYVANTDPNLLERACWISTVTLGFTARFLVFSILCPLSRGDRQKRMQYVASRSLIYARTFL
ncbi:glycosyltransferase [Gordonia sp. i37]|uniref:glycosyltransferase n=1 Tax=Gordonia sp. i37 TaxID=1961707 RepID=UPI0009AD3F3D|nr:glycosyltransferase [Gordonia sp. i37]OPX07454.1 hypothetical protein B1964_27790 [Gordonia sp. i37]